MYRIIHVLLLLIPAALLGSGINIKSFQVYGGSDQRYFPIIENLVNGTTEIVIEFDIEAQFNPDLNIQFYYCADKWRPVENNLLSTRGKDEMYNISITRVPGHIKGVDFHYSGAFPNEKVQFPYSGKWIFRVFNPFEREKILAEGKFFVINPVVPLQAELKKSTLENRVSSPAALGRTHRLKVEFNLPDEMVSSRVKYVEIIKNQEINNPLRITRDNFQENRFFEWNGSNSFSFQINDLRPGNEYRIADLRDINKYKTPDTKAHFEGVETTRFFKKGRRDNKGGSLLLPFENDYAEYMNVMFSIRPEEKFVRDIVLTGSFNDWEINPDYIMYYDDGLYYLPVELKRGIYDYSYVAIDLEGDKILNPDYLELEGNYWETDNDYRVFLYYEDVDKGVYTKIIGYKLIRSGELIR